MRGNLLSEWCREALNGGPQVRYDGGFRDMGGRTWLAAVLHETIDFGEIPPLSGVKDSPNSSNFLLEVNLTGTMDPGEGRSAKLDVQVQAAAHLGGPWRRQSSSN